MSQEFTVHGERMGDTGVVTVEGEVDLASAARLETALASAEAASHGGVLLDLCAVNFIDSTGLRVVLSSIKRLTEQSRALTVACPEGPVRRLFELTALTGQFELYDSRRAAVDSLQS